MSDHLTLQELLALRSKTLSRDRVLDITEHLSSCSLCTDASKEAFTVAGAISFQEALRRQGTQSNEEGDSAERSGMLKPFGAHAPANLAGSRTHREYSNRWMWAACIVIAVSGMISFVSRRRADTPSGKPTSTIRTTNALAVPVAQPVSYGRTQWDSMVAAAFQTGSLAKPKGFDKLRPESDTLRTRTADSTALLNPMGTCIESPRPEFSWPAAPGAEYVVMIARGNEPFLSSGRLRKNHWVVPSDLPRDEVLRWEVEVLRPDGSRLFLPAPPQPTALFRILAEEGASELADARQRFPKDHLLIGVLYAKHGVYQRAVEELQLYATEQPGSAIARRLLVSIRNW